VPRAGHSDRRLRISEKLVKGQWTRVSGMTAINEIGDKLPPGSRRNPAAFDRSDAARDQRSARFWSQVRRFWGTTNTDLIQGAYLSLRAGTGVAKPGYGAMTKRSTNPQCKTRSSGRQSGRGDPVSCSIASRAKEPQTANFIPSSTTPDATRRPCARICYDAGLAPTSRCLGMSGNLKNGWEDKEFIKQARLRFSRSRKEVEKWNPEEVRGAVQGVPGEQLKRSRQDILTLDEAVNVIWAMGPTQKNRRPPPTCGRVCIAC